MMHKLLFNLWLKGRNSYICLSVDVIITDWFDSNMFWNTSFSCSLYYFHQKNMQYNLENILFSVHIQGRLIMYWIWRNHQEYWSDFKTVFVIAYCITLRETCSYSKLFWSTFFPHFPAFGLNTERYAVFLCIQSECGIMREKCGPE